MRSKTGKITPQIFFAIAIVLFVAVAIMTVRSISALSAALELNRQTQRFITELDETLITMINAETGARGFLITGDDEILKPFNQAQVQAEKHLNNLAGLTADDPGESQKIAELRKTLTERLAFLGTSVEQRRSATLDEVKNSTSNGRRGRELSDQVRSIIEGLKTQETATAERRNSDLNSSLTYTRRMTYVAGFAGIFFLLIAAVDNFREVRRRRAAELELRKANIDLEKHVAERTAELQAANEKLKENIRLREETEQFHKIALASGRLGAWRTFLDDERTEVDDHGLTLFGLKKEDFDGSRIGFFKTIHPEDSEIFETDFADAIRENRALNAEFRILLPDGSERWLNCTGQPILDPSGKVVSIIGNCRDITEGKEREISLKRSETLVRNVIDSLFAFVGVLSPEGILLEANRTALQSAPLKAEDVIGKNFADTYWWEYSEKVQEKLRDAITRASAGEGARFDVDARVGEDKLIPIDFMLVPLYDDFGEITNLIASGVDLTPRLEAENALRKSELFAKTILNSLSAHIAVIDKNGDIAAVNNAWTRFAEQNCTAAEIAATGVGNNYLQITKKGESRESKEVFEKLSTILRGELDVFQIEYPCHSRDEERWFLLQATALHSADGGAVVSHLNITDRKQAEIELRNSEEFTRSIVENSPDCVKVLSLSGELLSMNEGGQSLMEIDDFERIKGRRWLDFWEGDDLELAYQAVELAKKGEVANFQGSCRTKKENLKWWDVSVAPVFDGSGKPTRLIAISRDMTERRKIEAALYRGKSQMEFVLEVAQLGIWSLDVETGMAERSLRHDQIFGYDELLPKWTFQMFIDHVLPEYREDVEQKFRQALDKGTEWQIETQIRRADGEIRWIWARGQSQIDSDGRTKLHGTVTDITERKEAEAERERLLENERVTRKDAEIANRLRDEFLATVSHELRAPLNSILGWGRLLEKGNLDKATIEKAITTIVRNAESQKRLIEDLLDVSRIISGKLRLEVITVNPLNIVESALETVRPAAEAKGIALEIKEAAEVSHISGDPNRLQQIIWNLLSNAIKFTPPDGKVTLKIGRENNTVLISVVDTGVGIKPEFLPHVFDRFSQADASSIRKFGGLGLGLAIVRHITEMHGGTVQVESEGEGKGSTFTVKLPVSATYPANKETSDVAKLQTNLETRELSLNGMLILVVDDEDDTRQLLVQALTFYGATVVAVSNASDALTEIRDKSPDFLVSDIGIPDEDGYTLIKKIRQLPDEKQKNLPAIALTAYTRAQDRIRALAAGFQSQVAKPVEPDELVMVIASLTGKFQAGTDK
ncbi:MAG: PAS domain S-box protein [Pyrinomonadaceae bacterium]|nr:PAS domain S-box protein [Pyrinomonadaceae bacterium]